jgi:hypothetical protein
MRRDSVWVKTVCEARHRTVYKTVYKILYETKRCIRKYSDLGKTVMSVLDNTVYEGKTVHGGEKVF